MTIASKKTTNSIEKTSDARGVLLDFALRREIDREEEFGHPLGSLSMRTMSLALLLLRLPLEGGGE